MDLEPWRLPAAWAWAGFALAVPAVAFALAALGRPGLRRALTGHVFPACTIAVLVLWQMRAAVDPAPAVHLLGASFLTLVLGPALALLGMLVVVLASTVDGAGGWSTLALNWLITGALPVAVTVAGLRFAEHRLPRNPFVYILVCAFAGGAVSMAATGLASGLVLVAATPMTFANVASSYWTAYLLLVFPEAFLTGTTLAWMSMFYPDWVATYAEDEPQRG